MTNYLIDANALIAFNVSTHQHHDVVLRWFAQANTVLVCPITEGALFRFIVRNHFDLSVAYQLLTDFCAIPKRPALRQCQLDRSSGTPPSYRCLLDRARTASRCLAGNFRPRHCCPAPRRNISDSIDGSEPLSRRFHYSRRQCADWFSAHCFHPGLRPEVSDRQAQPY